MKKTILNRKEKSILDLLAARKGEVINFHDILQTTETNPAKKVMFENCWSDLKVRKRYKNNLKANINKIRKKSGVKIENIKNVGYKVASY
jgi:DNA-binding response OmpR family regulator